MKARRRAYILGAGVSGLATGWMLSKHGWEVSLFEKEPWYGGLAFTRKWDEFDLDFGPHIYHTVSKELEELWEREFGDLFVKGEFWCKNVKGENFDEHYDYPLSYEAILGYPSGLRDKILTELKQVDGKRKSEAKSYREYVSSLVGPTLQEMFFEKYPQKLWGMTTKEMTANWAPKRIELREKRKPFYTGRWNAVGKFGSGCVMDRLAEKIQAQGGKIFLERPVSEIVHTDHTISEFRFARGEGIRVRPEDVVISTLPLNILASLFSIPCSLKFRGVISVALAFHRPAVLPEDLHFLYYDAPDIIFHRVSEQKKFSSAGFPEDKTFLTCEIAYSAKDALDQTDRTKLIERCLEDLIKVRLVKRKEFYKGIVQKRPCVYPLLTRDYEHQVREVQSRLAKNKQLYTVGGPAEYNYADIHINFLKALDLAKLLTDKYSDFYKVRREQVMAKRESVVSLNGKLVGEGHRPFIIAEAGLNHNGQLDLALRLVEEAKKANCDAVKFQTYSATYRVSSKMKRAQYAEQIIGLEENIYEMLSRLELSAKEHEKIFEYGRKIGIDVFSTPFDLPSVDLLESLNTPYYKVASSDLNNLPLLTRIARTGKPILLSTGMSVLGEVEESVNAILREGNGNIILLHCLSSYPANPEEINLNCIRTLKLNFQIPVGFSDHTLGLKVSTMALAIGADVIERHFTLNRHFEGPDHIFSSEPEEMRELTKTAAFVHTILGDGVKRIQPSEYETINSFKKTIYAQVPIKRGTVIEEQMLALKGPAGGLAPKFWSVVIGRVAKENIEADHPITWENV
jgi:sialic acid synthase SpsE/protoporphyrinogen oxidase